MAEVITITRDDVALGGRFHKKGATLSPAQVPEGVRELVKTGQVAGAEWGEGEAAAALASAAPAPITMAHGPDGKARQIVIPGPWEQPGTVQVVDAPVGLAAAVGTTAPTLTPADTENAGGTPTGDGVTPTGDGALTPTRLLDSNVEQVVAAVQLLDSTSALMELRVLEGAGKNRKGVLDAVDVRLAALKPQD